MYRILIIENISKGNSYLTAIIGKGTPSILSYELENIISEGTINNKPL